MAKKEYFIFNIEGQNGNGILFHMTPAQIEQNISTRDAKVVSFGIGDSREDVLEAFRCYDDYLKPKAVFARKCDCCGRGMDEGYLIEGTGETYCDREECTEAVHALITEAGYTGEGWADDWEEAYEDDFYCHTAWEDEVCFLQVSESETDLVEDPNAW